MSIYSLYSILFLIFTVVFIIGFLFVSCCKDTFFYSVWHFSFCCASRRSKSLWNSRSCKTRYFSNSLSAKLLAISSDTRPLSCRTSSSLSTCVAHWRNWVARSGLYTSLYTLSILFQYSFVYCFYTHLYTVSILVCILFQYSFVYSAYTLPILCLYSVLFAVEGEDTDVGVGAGEPGG